MIRLALTEAEQRDLLQLKRNGRNNEERWRASIILDATKGLTEDQLAERNDCSVSGVEKTLARYRRGGVAALRSARFRPHRCKLKAPQMALVAEAIRQSPRSVCPDDPHYDRSLWTLQLLVDYIEGHTGVHLGIETMRRYLLQLGWRMKSPKLSCTSPDPEYAAKMAAIHSLRERAEQQEPSAPLVFYCDEAKLESIPTMRRMRRPRGQPLPLPHCGEQHRRYLHGALCYPTGEWYFRVLPRMDTGSVLQFCQALLTDFPDRTIGLIMDSAPAHHSTAFAEFVAANPRLHVQYQPTYAPWTNPVERVWQEMRRWVTHAHELPEFADLLAAAVRWCERTAQSPQTNCRLASFQSANPAH